MIDELLLDDEEGGLELLDPELLQLRLDLDKLDIDLEEQQLEVLASLGEEDEEEEDVEK